MRFLKKQSFTIMTLVLLVGFWSEDAHAYIDPASGSYFFQLLVAGLLGALFALKIYWRSFKAFVGSLFGKKKEIGDESK